MAWLQRQPRGALSWGEVRPSRICNWEEGEDGVTVLAPRLGRGPIAKRLERLFGTKPFQIHLDTVGSFVWIRLDGTATVAEIAAAMRAEFGEKIEPVEDRLVQFLKTLMRGRFVSMDTHELSAEG